MTDPLDHALAAAPAPDECCSHCKFFIAPPAGSNMPPMCRRFPPEPFISKYLWDEEGKNVIGHSALSVFPYVHPASWCGEFIRNPSSVQ